MSSDFGAVEPVTVGSAARTLRLRISATDGSNTPGASMTPDIPRGDALRRAHGETMSWIAAVRETLETMASAVEAGVDDAVFADTPAPGSGANRAV